MIRVALIDDHPVVRLGLRVAVEASDRLALVGEGASLADAQRLVAEASPDLLLLDMRLPDGSAVHAVAPLLAARPALRVLILTGSGSAADAHEALRVGAHGYLTKDDLVDTLVGSILAVMAGEVVISPSVRAEMREIESRPSMTARERDVLALLVKGFTNREIGRLLGISAGTVRTHVSRILSKLDVADRTEAASVATRHGLA